MFQFIQTSVVKGGDIVRAFARHSNENVTLGKHVTKHENMRIWMEEFFRKTESRNDEIARVNSIAFQIYKFSLILYVVGVC